MLNPFEERWFLVGACAFALGVFWAQSAAAIPAVLTLFVLFVVFARLRRPVLTVFAAFACLGVAAMGLFSLKMTVPAQEGNVTGRLAAYPVVSAGGDTVLILDSCEVDGSALPGRVRVYCKRPPAGLEYGNTVSFSGKLNPPNPRMNPHTQSARLSAWSKGICLNANADAVKNLGGVTFMTYVMRLRTAMQDALHELYGDDSALTLGMLFGDTSEMDETELKSFRDAGISHLLAVSGLHTGIIAGAVYWLLKRFKLRGVPALVPVYAVLALYAALTGFSPSVTRAAVMLSLGLAARELGECADTANTAGCAALIIMALNPAALFSLSFQLSFAAVLGIAFFSAGLTRLFTLGGRLGDRFGLAAMAGVTLSAQLGTLLIQMSVFGTISPLAMLANLIALPFVSAALILALIAGAAGCVFLPLGRLPASVGGLFLMPVEFAGKAVASMPFSKAVTGAPNVVFIAAALAVFAALSCWCVSKKLRLRLGAAALVLLCVSLALTARERAQTSITMLYVGNSDAIVVRNASSAVMIDAGTAYGGYSSGSSVIAPYLYGEGISELDAVILTHPHLDHYGGLSELAGQVGVKRVIIPEGTNDADFGGLLSLLERSGTAVEKVGNGGKIETDGLSFDVFQVDPDAKGDENRQSLVLAADLRGRRALFMGDAEMTCEYGLSGALGRCDILKVGHHGAKTGTTQAFLNEVRPKLAIISVGINNRYGHPSAAVIEKLERNGAAVLRTDELGCVTLKIDDNAVKAYCEVEH